MTSLVYLWCQSFHGFLWQRIQLAHLALQPVASAPRNLERDSHKIKTSMTSSERQMMPSLGCKVRLTYSKGHLPSHTEDEMLLARQPVRWLL